MSQKSLDLQFKGKSKIIFEGKTYVKNYGFETRKKRKLEILTHYSEFDWPQCSCCGIRHLDFLTIDHINNDGAEHRRELRKDGEEFYNWLIKNSLPDGYQVLCFNCNFSKHLKGRCIHEDYL